MLEMLLLPYPLLGLLLLTLLGAALLGAALLSRQCAPARNKIPRAQRRREVALQQMAALAQRLREQVSRHQPLKPPASIPTGGSFLRTHPSHGLIPFRRQRAWGDSPPFQLYARSLCHQFLPIYVL